jgi:heme-degrading monooxygenase HmoA
MVHEIAQIDILPGTHQRFEDAVRQAAPLFQRAQGCHGMMLQHSIEHPDRYFLVVQWETVEAHTVGFRESQDFTAWRALASPFFAKPPEVQHVDTVAGPY